VPVVPSSAEAALVFLILFVPGYLYLAGYRLGRAVTEHREGIGTVAKVIAISAVIAVVAWKLGGQDLYEAVRTGTALTTGEAFTWRFVVAILAIPGLLGFVAGELVDEAAHRVSEALDRRRDPQPTDLSRRKLKVRACHTALEVMGGRLLPDGPTTWDRVWRHLRRTQDYVYVRVTTKSGQEIVGTMTNRSRIALSPQPHDLYIEQILRQAEDGQYYPTAYGLGAFVSGQEIDVLEWASSEGLTRKDENDA
jgi:hypothetical protein